MSLLLSHIQGYRYHLSKFHIYALVYCIAGRNINNLRYADETTLMAEREEELKSLLIKLKEKSEKAEITKRSENEDHGIIQSAHLLANR